MNLLLLLLALPQAPSLVATEQAKLLASDTIGSGGLGLAVALDGDTAVVGATGQAGNASTSGAAYVYVRSGGVWTEQAKLAASDGAAGDLFGWSVALDGDTAVVGALFDQDAGPQSGAAYVFQRTGSSWTEQAKLVAGDAASGDQFGWSVSIDGDSVVAGAPFDTHTALFEGSAYVFTRSGVSWSEQAKLTASQAAPADNFGGSTSISGDTVLIGASGLDGAAGNTGAAFVYVRSGTSWSEQAMLDDPNGTLNDEFGFSVALDADTALIGMPGDDDLASRAGAALVFTRAGSSWSQQAKLTVGDGGIGDTLGWAVALDGDAAVLGAPADDDGGPDAGAAYTFLRNGGVWTEQVKLVAGDAEPLDDFGTSVAVSGATGLIGSPGDDDACPTQFNCQSGAAYTYTFAGGPPALYCTAGTSFFGCTVSLGATGDASASASSGFTLFGQNAQTGRFGSFIFGTNGRQAMPWGTSDSFMCVVPPLKRGGVVNSVGTGSCGGGFAQDLNALWCSTCPAPQKNPGAGAVVQAQLWYRDPMSTSNQTTVFSNAIEFLVAP